MHEDRYERLSTGEEIILHSQYILIVLLVLGAIALRFLAGWKRA